MDRPVAGSWFRASLLAAILVAGCAAGPTSPPSALATPSPSDTSTTSPSAPESTPTSYEDFMPPTPRCPAPAEAARPPVMTVGVKGGPSRPADMGSSSVVTCSTAGSDDRVVPEPKAPVLAKPGDLLVFTLSPGWRILAWQASEHPKGEEGATIIAGTTTLDQPMSIEVPVASSGDSIIAVDAWCLRSDGRAVSSVSAFAWVRVGG
jgi:hypothetical protein